MVTDPHFKVTASKEDEIENIDDVEYPHITDIMMKEEITMGAPIVNRANKRNAMMIYEENRNLNDVINERKILSDEHSKTNQQLEDAEKTMRNSQVSLDPEEYQRMNFRIWELETEKKNQVSFLNYII